MRTISIGIIGVALCGFALSACSSSGPASVVAPTAVGTPGASAAAVVPNTSDNNPNFWNDSLMIGPGTWEGSTTPDSPPTTGHPGHLTVVFHGGVLVKSTLYWERIPDAADSCHVDAEPSTPGFPMTVSCGKNKPESLIVHPSVTTKYTFFAMKSGVQWWKSHQVEVIVDPNVSITATWNSTLGTGDDDPGVFYQGHVHPPLNGEIQVDTDSTSTYCGLSNNRTKEAAHFHASMTLSEQADVMTGDYDSQLPTPGSDTCLQDHGSFTLKK